MDDEERKAQREIEILETLRLIERQLSLITTFIIKVDPLIERVSVMLNGTPTEKLRFALGREKRHAGKS